MVIEGHPLFQVFSVSVHHKEHKPVHLCGEIDENDSITKVIEHPIPEKSLKLYGTIKVVHGINEELFLFNQPRHMPICVNNNDTVPLSINSKWSTTSLEYDVRFDLKDADGDVEISRGWLTHDVQDPEWFYSKRLSSAISGHHGGAVMYYTPFDDSVQAYVKIQLLMDDGIDTAGSNYVVSGGLFARYGGHDYSSEYERKHYQIVLFNRKPNESLQLMSLDGNSKSYALPLLSPLSVVPIHTSLIIVADLIVKFGETEIASVCGTTEFLQDASNRKAPTPTFNIIPGKDVSLHVRVFWSHWECSLLC